MPQNLKRFLGNVNFVASQNSFYRFRNATNIRNNHARAAVDSPSTELLRREVTVTRPWAFKILNLYWRSFFDKARHVTPLKKTLDRSIETLVPESYIPF